MYFNKDNNFYHGIMFHHFHDDKIHKNSPGSISKDELLKIINFIGKKNILDADIFFDKFTKKKLSEQEVCFTFDDGIKSQIDVALPVLEDFKIKSFFFIHTAIFEGKPDNLEIFRYFRSNFFNSHEEFYKAFYKILNEQKELEKYFHLNKEVIKHKKDKFPFYTNEDIKFRLVRDDYLTLKGYEKVVFEVMKDKNFNPEDHLSNLFFNKDNLILLNSLGHQIGLHSHNHSTLIEKLSYEEQNFEYQTSINTISKILKKNKNEIKYMSHPCGSYNNNTLEILKDLGIELGFKQIMEIEAEKGMKKINNSNLEVARQDHVHILNMIKNLV